MSGEVNRVPWGLLSLLDMSARGSVPRDLAPALSATIEIFDLYALQNRESRVGGCGPISSTGQFLDNSAVPGPATLVPDGEIWYLWKCHIRPTAALNGAGGALIFSPVIRANENQRQRLLAPPSDVIWTNADLPTEPMTLGPIWMKGGDILGCFVHRYTAFTVQPSMIIEAEVTRFRV